MSTPPLYGGEDYLTTDYASHWRRPINSAAQQKMFSCKDLQVTRKVYSARRQSGPGITRHLSKEMRLNVCKVSPQESSVTRGETVAARQSLSGPIKFVSHSKSVLELAIKEGWRPGARYTNMRDVRHNPLNNIGFLDIHWKQYNFSKHLEAVAQHRPFMTVARDIESVRDLDSILVQATSLKRYARHVILVPKAPQLEGRFNELLPAEFMLGFSVPSRYGSTHLRVENFGRAVHLLGGRPDVQRRFASVMPVASVDCNRFTLDARFGDYFDGKIFRPHPKGGYLNCLVDSISNINKLWDDYQPAKMINGISP